ncbi:PH domain-containing protein [Actinoplanes sp. NPDC049265]|uniref:PH domain-containing protein n=1 Tax=Actinoplanes sp. NPDC049265 TaxID=3363902 RepID=UPI003719E2C3
MPFPDDVLTEEEELVLHLHPHAKAAVRPVLALLFSLAVTIVAWVMLPDNDGGLIGVCVVAALALFFALTRGVAPLVVWRCTHYVFTDQRVLTQEGVLTRIRRDIPLGRVNDHTVRQSLWDRMFGCGTVTITSIGDQPLVLPSVPRAQELQTTLYQLVEDDHLRVDDQDEEDDEEDELSAGGRPAPTPPAQKARPRRQDLRR